jgi:hypothetical protein
VAEGAVRAWSVNMKIAIRCVLFVGLGIIGCSRNPGSGGGDAKDPPDMVFTFPVPDLAGADIAGNNENNACGDQDPSCTDNGFGPAAGQPFPLPTDKPADPNVGGSGVSRDKNGYLKLDSTSAAFNFAWTANTEDWGHGTVSKFDTKTVREVARYFTVTCQSLPTGSRAQCDGANGCCAKDSYPQWQNRKNNMAQGPYQQVEMTHVNRPSRTAIDFDGTMWVANRALYQQGAQSSVTKIANDVAECLDRNKNGKVETSRDVNGDGIIQTDCNNNGQPDDLLDVKNAPCANGLGQEFYGYDDECILLTTNTGGLDAYGRPLALGPGAQDFGPSDVWAGLFNTKQVFRIDGTTGLYKAEVNLPCAPYGFVIDASSIGWAANLGPAGCYWDTKNPQSTANIRQTNLGQSSYGIGIDRDQNIWFGGTAARYTPVRNKGFADLGQGFWTVFSGINGSGVAVDSRNANAYFAYFAGSKLYQVPASTIPLPNGQDVSVQAGGFPSVNVDSSGKGAGVASDGNIIVTSGSYPGITRVVVDAMGMMTQPMLNQAPMGNNLCPTGDNCRNVDRQNANMQPYTYSDYTGFGLRTFTRPKGSYTYVQKGCIQNDGTPNGETKWLSVVFDADVPLNTLLSVKARSGNTPMPDQTWGMWTPDFQVSPADMVNGMALVPNEKDSGYIQVEFDFTSMAKNSTPALKEFHILHECIGGIM